MTRRFSLFLALRYLKPKRTFLSTITLVSVLGVTLGIMVLILVISVMTGFERELRRKVVGFDAHVVLTGGGILEDWEKTSKIALQSPEVTGSAPFVQGPVIVEFNNRRLAPKIRGVDPEMERAVVDITPFLIDGSYDLNGNKTLLGSELARELGAGVGDVLPCFPLGTSMKSLTKSTA